MDALALPLEASPSAGFLRRQVRRAIDLATLGFGFVTMIALLAFVATIPLVQVLSLGYLLEAEGRVARTGKLRGALPGLRTLARLGGATLGILLTFVPFLIVRDLRHDAILIDSTSKATHTLGLLHAIFGLAGLVHASLALLRGGRLTSFFRPLTNVRSAFTRLGSGEGISLAGAREAVSALRLPHYFALGAKGFFAALIWIALPTALLAVGPKAPPIALLGGFLLAVFVIPLPLLQANLAATGRFKAGFDLPEAWRRYRRAPIASLLALALTLALSVPLNVLKIELIPRDALVLAAGVFLLTILPTKLAAGKAWARGGREGRAFFPLRFVAALGALALAGAYVLVLFLTRFIEWQGAVSLFEQHAFLVPVAFY